MEIRFDPLNEREAEAVAQFLRRDKQTIHIALPKIEPFEPGVPVSREAVHQYAESLRGKPIKPADLPDAGRDVGAYAQVDAIGSGGVSGDTAQSAGPLPPAAPLPAAADLFGTAPAAPTAGAPSAAIVPSPPAVPAPPTVAPPAPAAPTPRAENGDLDNSGLPWDARIHSGTKAKNADGSWRQRRGLNDPELVKSVEAELRALMAIPKPESTGADIPMDTPIAPAAAASAAPLPVPAVTATETAGSIPNPTSDLASAASEPAGNVPPPPVPAPAPLTSAPATAPIPSPPAVPAPPTVAAPAAPVTFAGLMRKMTDGIAQRKFTEADVHEGLAELSLQPTDIGKLSANPDLLARMNKHVDMLLGVVS